MALRHATSGEVIGLRGCDGTAALVKTRSFETIHLVMKAGDSIPTHKVAGAMTLYCIEGAVSIELDGEVARMASGHWLYLGSGVPHALHGEVDSTLLLTILFEQEHDDAAERSRA